ncbi:bifunctional tRNA (5-methylaminomethyl-2-thiouridine)(34)-methyltransferase MnmD/FAD-dependent 5-carboxymethylaminomethyl-2-thiouridine(34) oxidoreductase MnmC [Wenzhouxiangella limi]|uniref:tRNA 5-methylaminomethyl-2-thiouridine biosynthesis bifunctional protein MnmC n=1 Tax=Wenzhouxiangella limi TaxID=2707351 RepID=A0A845VFC1_9GAMM|nr:bifunctional tRNA (5-methylaminomethyl-2-thiouridine)(34)-methyltransferase MnmD/FAD-dependent 5-carboxymethylaminomethyl-2-thiouridine(34) oxidoreductase MnmC [Wenzhouxiangella limi]NDY95919.1 bifunctional tRNA (5-methylaminomethyl-2-thiouridine)(34)-methyltransferase MnmD/FAD-dependent 5-carboxymethylaminomethyl-2-thiouridine(34) oxidoreductase MnmC [Wenzhouxiangella limi]
MSRPFKPIQPAVIDWQDQTPRSLAYQDSYSMPGRSVAESRSVFIEANRLPERFAGLGARALFVIGETGFGSGLNVLLAARCFLDHAPPDARLDLFSAELHPLTPPDLIRAQPEAPELAGLSAALVAAYPPSVAGHHVIELHARIRLVLMLGDAAACWQGCRAEVDAWFLDGFAPARNPAMWSEALFTAVADRSRPGATFGTFTAAGPVRRGLERAGFAVERVAGFGGKRHRLIGQRPGTAPPRRLVHGQAVVAGAGLAGCTTARALAERGWRVRVCDPAGVASAASGNLAGVVYSTASAHMTAQNRFYQLALVHALARLRSLGFPGQADDGRLNGVIQLAADERMARKIDAALAAGTWPQTLMERLGPRQVLFHGAGYLRPARWCRHLLDHPAIELTRERVQGFSADGGLQIQTDGGGRLAADVLVLAMAGAVSQLPALDWLPLKTIRGQVSYVPATAASRQWEQAVCHAGYLTPALDGLHCVGATFDLHETDTRTRADDDRTNLDQLREHLPEHWQALGGSSIEVAGRRAAVRCQTPDFLPLAGPLPDPGQHPHRIVPGVYLNLAHGSRGLTHTPLCADLIADQASGLSPFPDAELIAALAPERFILRKRRRDPGWKPAAPPRPSD